MIWVHVVIQGVLLGAVYALFACGLSLMFGVMRIINLAHGDIAVVGAYLVWVVATRLHVSPVLALAAVLPVMGIADGPTATVMGDANVRRAYLGEAV